MAAMPSYGSLNMKAAAQGYGGYFTNNSSGTGIGLYADETGGGSNSGYGGYFVNNSSNGAALYAGNSSSGLRSLCKCGLVQDAGGSLGAVDGSTNVTGGTSMPGIAISAASGINGGNISGGSATAVSGSVALWAGTVTGSTLTGGSFTVDTAAGTFLTAVL